MTETYLHMEPSAVRGLAFNHDPTVCVNDPTCAIHKPSEHPLNTAPLMWRSDWGIGFLERICVHGVGHPDPDDLAYKRRTWGADLYHRTALDVHGCDGCCH
jgi:hypothetical protein